MNDYTSQFDYIEALKRALTMANVPYERAESVVRDYRQRFIDGLAAGRSEADIAAGLDDPRRVAINAKEIPPHLAAAKTVPRAGAATQSGGVKIFRTFFSGLGLLIFNFFMLIPAMVYASLMFALFAVSITSYLAGIAVTASSLAGVNELSIDGPVRHVLLHRHSEEDDARSRVSLKVDSDGIRFTPAEVNAVRSNDVENGELFVSGFELDDTYRSKGGVIGVLMIVAGILLTLLSMVMTRFTWLGLKGYARMNWRVLRGE